MRTYRGSRLLMVALALVLVACGGPAASSSPGDTVEPSPSDAPTVMSSPEASPSAAATAVPTSSPVAVATDQPNPCGVPKAYNGPWPNERLLPGSAVHISVAELNLRDGPCTAARKLATLKKGKLLIVTDFVYGPVKADGYAWYQVLFPPNAPKEQLPTLPDRWYPDGTDTDGGWIAVTDGLHDYVTPALPRCPTTVNTENVEAMLPAEWLWCFDKPIVLKGTYGCGGCGGEGGPLSDPRWLGDTFEFEQLHVRWSDGYEYTSVPLHFAPDGPKRPAEGSIIRVTVHLDDPAAAACTFVWHDVEPAFTVAKQYGTDWCRERFVVDSYEVTGTDPDYTGT